GPDAREERLLVRGRYKCEHPGVWPPGLDLTDRVDAAAARQHRRHCNIRRCSCPCDRRRLVTCDLGHDLNAVFGLEHGAQAGTSKGVIVDHQDPNVSSAHRALTPSTSWTSLQMLSRHVEPPLQIF